MKINVTFNIKVMGFHSMMFHEKDPLGAGRPDADDYEIIKKMVVKVYKDLGNGCVSPLSLETLDYQPEAVSSKNKSAMTQPWKTTPRRIAEERCTQCGICSEHIFDNCFKSCFKLEIEAPCSKLQSRWGGIRL